MIVKWQTSSYNTKIERVECLRETEQSVFFPGRRGKDDRRAKFDYRGDGYFNTWSEAHHFLLERARTRLLSAAQAVTKRQNEYDELAAMEGPE